MFFGIQTSSHGIDHERDDGRHHSDKTRKGKLMPWIFLETIGPKHVERIRQNVHETGSENDAGCKGFEDDEHASIGVQRRDGSGEERRTNADHTRKEDGENGNNFETQRFVFVGT